MHLYMSWLFHQFAPSVTIPHLSRCNSFCYCNDKCHLVLLTCSQNIIVRIFSLNLWFCHLNPSACPFSSSAMSAKGHVCLLPLLLPLPPPSLGPCRSWGDAWPATSHASQDFCFFLKVSCLWILRLQVVRRRAVSLFCISVTHSDTNASCF